MFLTPSQKIVYLYNALGNKLKKTFIDGQSTMVTDYVSNMIYADGVLAMVMTEEGRMVPLAGGGYRAEYYLKDHLGNNRVLFSDTDGDGDADILQENHFYPYGMSMGDLNYVSGLENEFMYQGKEEQEELGLYWYDFGARMFDEQLGRWHVPDPMLQYSSPYVGMGNRPSGMVDPDEMWSDAAYMSDVRGFDAYRLSRYRTYHNYSRGNNLLGKTMDQLQFEQMLGDISISQADAFARSLESIIWGRSVNPAVEAAMESLQQQDKKADSGKVSPILFIDFDKIPNGMDVEEYINQLKDRLIENGVNPDLRIIEEGGFDSFFAKIEAFFSSAPTADITFKEWNIRDSRSEGLGGYAELNSGEAILYTGLSDNYSLTDRVVETWKYVNVSMHELGHAVWGFKHDENGHTNYRDGIMDYRSTLRNGANFSPENVLFIKHSQWGL